MLRERAPRLADAGLLGSSERREFLRLAAASIGLAGLAACSRSPQERIVPYVHSQPLVTPGLPLYFATAHVHAGYARGVLVESHMGRPTKVEGNPRHPASLGATDIFAQASVLQLWDPDRSQTVLRHGEIATWDRFLAEFEAQLPRLEAARGAGLAVLTGTVTSPTLAAQMQALQARLPQARWHAHDPLGRGNVHAGARLAFGRPLEPRHDFSRAEVVVALDADFLAGMPGSVRHAHDFAARRAPPAMNRLYAFEPGVSLTGAMADHRFAVRAGRIEAVARALAARLGLGTSAPASPASAAATSVTQAPATPATEAIPSEAAALDDALLDAIARDLRAHRGASLVLAGDRQPPQVHAIVHAINAALGNHGATISFSDPVAADVRAGAASLAELARDLEAGAVDTLLILEANPAYDAPVDLDFDQRIARARLSVHLGLHADETAHACHWHVPAAHALESWSDARAHDGTVTILQPLIAPLYDGRSAHELLALLLDRAPRTAHDIVREFWLGRMAGTDAEARWTDALQRGVVPDTRLPDVAVPVPAMIRSGAASVPGTATSPDAEAGLELDFVADPTVWDGRYANIGWLQECPKPLTSLTWDNAVLIAPALAARLGIASEDEVELSLAGRAVRAAAWIAPGHADGAVTLSLGYGRTHAGRVGSDIGTDAYLLRTSDAPWFANGASLRRTGARRTLAVTQHHHAMEGGEPVRAATLAHWRDKPDFAHEDPPDQSLYPPFAYDGYKWGMSVNLNACIGCNACTIACQAENNIAVVGKEQVRRGREMHWIRVDRYHEGDADAPRTLFQPVPCMQCETAPCEVVCPVEASVHDDEGINVQVYNRCVGTRFCSNNCPYKVRRFNWLEYSSDEPALKAQKNPEVTVRSRGVMEKCNYCLQRIANARIEAQKENRRIRDGEVVTACQAACPTEAIVFGDLNDAASRVSRAKADARDYALLGELGTRPRTTYLAKLTNPNPEIG